MILRILVNTANLNINNQTVRVLRVYNRNIPAGITEAEFTQKGGVLAGSGAGTFGELAPGSAGQYLTPDTAEPLGLKWETPTVTVDDTTNHLMNGGFIFAQRQTPGTLTTITDGSYGPDRWKMTRENADLQYIRVDGSSESGLISPYYGQFKKITNAGKLLICQPLEYLDTLKFRGKVLNFQLQMKASASKTIKIAIVELQSGGTADTLPTLVSAWGADGTDPTLGANLATIGTPISCSVTTAWQVFQFTGTFPATSKNLLVMVWSNADFAANDTLSLAEVGLYFGESQRSWTPRPIAQEVALCKRYYQKSYNVNTAPATATLQGGIDTHSPIAGTGAWYKHVDIIEMRTVPTVKSWDNLGASEKVFKGAAGKTSAYGSHSPSRIFVGTTDATSATELFFHFSADAEL